MNLPEKFERFNEARRNSFIKAKELKESNKKMVGTFCIIGALGAAVIGFK